MITLAGKLEKDRADDAISLYQRVIKLSAAKTNTPLHVMFFGVFRVNLLTSTTLQMSSHFREHVALKIELVATLG